MVWRVRHVDIAVEICVGVSGRRVGGVVVVEVGGGAFGRRLFMLNSESRKN